MIIGIIGKKKVGKDTFANYICSNCNEDTFVKMAFADTLKTVCKEIFDLSDSQLHDTIQKDLIDPRWSMSPRQILQFVGTDLFRKHFRESIWIDNMKLKLSKLCSKQNHGSNIKPDNTCYFMQYFFFNTYVLLLILKFRNLISLT